MNNQQFFKNNIDFYSEEYRDYSLKPWEKLIVDSVSGEDVLDVACGGGRITVPLLRRGYNVTGTDFVGEFEAKIRRHKAVFTGRFEFVESDMTKLPFSNETFDSITCINSLVYLRNAEEAYKALKEMCRVLRPTGKLFITTWNIRHPYWGISVVLNYLLGRGKKFGETSPFWSTDSRINNSPTRMFVPTKGALEQICWTAGIRGSICTGREFTKGRSLLSPFHPILVITGTKKQ